MVVVVVAIVLVVRLSADGDEDEVKRQRCCYLSFIQRHRSYSLVLNVVRSLRELKQRLRHPVLHRIWWNENPLLSL